jgi:hypothetical protein
MTLIDKHYVAQVLNHEAKWNESHGARSDYLGAGMLYYALVYAHRSQLAVCLGSGGGFVPRLIRQAQRDLELPDSRTVLVDANLPEAGWGSPAWLREGSYFRTAFSDIEIRMEKSIDSAKGYFLPNRITIDYLHIDADHSLEGCIQDFFVYSPLVSSTGVITFHDTSLVHSKVKPRIGVPRVIEHIQTLPDWEVINFAHLGCGTAIVKRKCG